MQLNRIFQESFNVTESQLSDEEKLWNFAEWDSLTHMFFITKLEECYGVELTGDDIANMQTVGDVKKIIISKGREL
jgi:acyl carrier protein